jgi:ATP-binding cassette subfamily D (ALD) protein 3
VELYSNLSKPILDVVIYSLKLTSTHGAGAPGAMLGYLVIAGMFLTALRRPVARLTALEQESEGEFRFVNSRLIANGEGYTC